MTAGVETEHGGLYCSSFLALLAGAVTATAGAEMVEQILQRSKGYATRADLDAALSTQGIESGIQNISTQLCNGFAGVNSNISNLGYQLQDCCCQTQRAVDGVNYNMAMQTNTLQQALCSGFRDVIDSQNAGTQRIIDTITQDKIQSLQTELQSAQLQLANVSQTNNIINTLRPTPVPAYITCSPYQAAYGYGNGCGNCAC